MSASTIVIVFEAVFIVLFVRVSVVALPTNVSVAAGNVIVVVPATAVAFSTVVPLVAPDTTKVLGSKVLAPVTV